MKSLLKNPFFYVTLILSALLAFEVYHFVVAAGVYTSNNASPPQGQVFPPLDTSSFEQFKSGNFGAGVKATPNVELQGNSPAIQFHESANSTAQIYITGGKLYFQNQGESALAIGAGTGGAGVGWTLAANGTDIYNNTGNVGIGITNPGAKLEVAGDILVGPISAPTSQYFYEDTYTSSDKWTTEESSGGKGYSNMPCDYVNGVLDNINRDCWGSYQTDDTVGMIKYDNFTDTDGAHKKEKFQVVAHTTAANSTGKITAGDIDLTNPSWSGASNEVLGQGVPKFVPGKVGADVWAMCPSGYFVVGIRFGITTEGWANPVVKCNKL